MKRVTTTATRHYNFFSIYLFVSDLKTGVILGRILLNVTS